MTPRLVLSTLFLVAATPAFAHVGQHLGFSAASGFAHPLMGLDHLAAMIAVGLWAAMVGGKRIWIWPAAFVVAMLVGGFIGHAGIELPQVEPIIALSVIVLGLLVATGIGAPVPVGAVLDRGIRDLSRARARRGSARGGLGRLCPRICSRNGAAAFCRHRRRPGPAENHGSATRTRARCGNRCARRLHPDAVRCALIPGEWFIKDGDIEINAGRKTVTVMVANIGDRPIQVGSHYHFFETNSGLSFDRQAARGMRLNIPAGTAVRFEPGQSREVTLVALAGARRVYGFRQDVMGDL